MNVLQYEQLYIFSNIHTIHMEEPVPSQQINANALEIRLTRNGWWDTMKS